MNAWKTTFIFIIGAGVLAALAAFTTWKPAGTSVNDDQGDEFYPKFKDALAATSIEIVTYDEAKGKSVPFKVAFMNGRWCIPSHFNYPADAQDTLKKVATQYIGIIKNDVRSDRPQDHEGFGVVDPLDTTISSAKGRGKRVIFRDAQDQVLADLIIGSSVKNKGGYSYVRIPGKPRTYAVQINATASNKFEDWVETDLLKLNSSDITRLKFNNYSFDEFQGRLVGLETLALIGEQPDWKIESGMSDAEEIVDDKVRDLIRSLDNLKLVNVQPKHAQIVEFLKEDQRLTQTPNAVDIMTTAAGQPQALGAGFYILGKETGNDKVEVFVLSNEGELTISCKNGVSYVLRHGDVAASMTDGQNKPPEDQDDKEAAEQRKEDRFMIVTVYYDETVDPEPVQPVEPAMPRPVEDKPAESAPPAEQPAGSDEAKAEAANAWDAYDKALGDWTKKRDEWTKRVEEAKTKVKELNERFANWYYVIPGDDFLKLRLTRNQIVRVIPKVQITTLESGSGDEVKKDQTLSVLYTGWLMNADGSQGKEFDSNQNRDTPFTFEFGGSGVIDGWQKGAEGMKVGEKRRLVIPPELGYGEKGQGADIPPNATLIFEITLLKAEDKKPGDE